MTGYASSRAGSLTPGTRPISGPPGASNLCRRQSFKIITRPRQQLPCLFSSWCWYPVSPIFHPRSFFAHNFLFQPPVALSFLVFTLCRLPSRFFVTGIEAFAIKSGNLNIEIIFVGRILTLNVWQDKIENENTCYIQRCQIFQNNWEVKLTMKFCRSQGRG